MVVRDVREWDAGRHRRGHRRGLCRGDVGHRAAARVVAIACGGGCWYGSSPMQTLALTELDLIIVATVLVLVLGLIVGAGIAAR